MVYKDPIHRVLSKLNESENINPGNFELGQAVEVLVTDASGAQFVRDMIVSLFYPAGEVLLKDEETGDTITLRFEWDDNENLVYRGSTPYGVSYELQTDRSRLSSHSIKPKLNESIESSECQAPETELNEAIDVDEFLDHAADILGRLTDDRMELNSKNLGLIQKIGAKYNCDFIGDGMGQVDEDKLAAMTTADYQTLMTLLAKVANDKV